MTPEGRDDVTLTSLYVSGLLTADEMTAFEKRMKSDKEFAATVEIAARVFGNRARDSILDRTEPSSN
jgi:anti-sigma-K factor RskA